MDKSKSKYFLSLKSLDTNTTMIGTRIPNWQLRILQSDISNPLLDMVTNLSAAINRRLADNMKIDYLILLGWIRLNNMTPLKQLSEIKNIISTEDIERVLYNNDMLRLYKKPKNEDDIIYILQFIKSEFWEEISNYYINK